MTLQFRHPRGRGLIFDSGDVSRGSFVSRDSVVKDNARVRDAELWNESCAAEDCQIFGGVIDRSWIGGNTIIAGDPTICAQSIVHCRSVSGRPLIRSSALRDLVEVWDQPTIIDVELRGAVMVYGHAQLFGPWSLGGFARIHEGTWTRPPRTVLLEHGCLTECVDGRILVDCRCRTPEYWLKYGSAFGRRNDWTEEQIEQTLEVIRNWEVS